MVANSPRIQSGLSPAPSLLQPSYLKASLGGHDSINPFPSKSHRRSPSALPPYSEIPSSPAHLAPSGKPPSFSSNTAVSIAPTQRMTSQHSPSRQESDFSRPADDTMEEAESPISDRSEDAITTPQTTIEGGDISVNTTDERPRIRAEGPGGADIKRGARIACLECRSAKIRCSAPNDGQVPCRRCARHDKECVFEKHRRGRKPGRGNLPKQSLSHDSRSGFPGGSLHRNPSDHQFSSAMPAGHHYGVTGQWSPPLPTSQSLPHLPSPSGYISGAGSGSMDYFSRPPALGGEGRTPSQQTPRTAPPTDSSKPRHPHPAHPGPLPHFPRQPEPFRSSLRSPYEGTGPSLQSSHAALPSQPLGSISASASSSRQHGFFSPPLPRAEASSPQGHSSFTPLPPGRDENYSARWGPTFNSSSVRQSANRGGPPESPRLGGDVGASGMGPPPLAKTAAGPHGGPKGLALGDTLPATSSPSASSIRPLGVAPPPPPPRGGGRSSEDDEEEDELVDEDDVGGAHQDTTNALSRPLQLLAYASTAAARRQTQGGYRDPRSVAAAASLGLIPQLQQAKAKRSHRSPGKEKAHLSAGGGEPATLENGNWEYKAGRVRAIKVADASQSPASLSDDAGQDAASGQQAPVLTDSGPHLGKRRRSDDEPLPLPRSRRQSELHKSDAEGDSRAGAAQVQTIRAPKAQQLVPTSPEHIEPAAGASRKGYFRFSLYSSKLDVDDKDDPINAGVATQEEMEGLFDVYFNQINPINVIFDPFLHSLSYVRARSKFLLTVIASQAARMSQGARQAELAEKLEHHWRVTLLPSVLLGGYKSVEISQAFLLASQFHRPTHIIVEDRAWQYLGFAIRTATEIGVNISLAPNGRGQEDEQITRRLRNRERLWLSLVIAEGILSTQFGRPCTLSVKDTITQSPHWNREDYSLPEDAALVCQIELRKIVETWSESLGARGRSKSEQDEDPTALMSASKSAWQELEKWKQTWSPSEEGLDHMGIGGSMAMSAFLVRWSPYSRLIYSYWRCHLNSIVLQLAGGTAARQEVTSPVAYDSMVCARQLLDTLLDDKQIGASRLALAPNAVVVMATYAAVSALRLTKLDHSRHALIDQRGIFEQVQRLAGILEEAGRTPSHRDGAAGPYGLYLRSVLALFDNDSKSSSSVASETPAHHHGAPEVVGLPDGALGDAHDQARIASALAETADALLRETAAATATTTTTSASGLAPLTPALDSLGMPVSVADATGAGVYASDSEVWEYLANAPAGASLWSASTESSSSSAAAAPWNSGGL